MTEDLVERYNYRHFRSESFGPWMNFDDSPAVGTRAESFSLVSVADGETAELPGILSQNLYTVVEFGSFT